MDLVRCQDVGPCKVIDARGAVDHDVTARRPMSWCFPAGVGIRQPHDRDKRIVGTETSGEAAPETACMRSKARRARSHWQLLSVWMLWKT